MCCGMFCLFSSCRLEFMEKSQEILEDRYSDFDTFSNLEKTSYALGNELWEEKDFRSLLIKEFRVDVWEFRKACPGPSLTPWGGIGVSLVKVGMARGGKLSHSSDAVDACTCTYSSVNLHVNVCG